MSISIIIPVYNEEECIEFCVAETQKAFRDTDYQIIVVNDGSTDRSHEIIAGLLNGDRRLQCISYAANKGKSHAVRQGIQIACMEYTSYLDADLQYPATQLRQMYEFALKNNPEFVLGKPTRKYYNPYRHLLSRGYNLLVSRLLDLPVSDANAVKLIKTERLKSIRLYGDLGAVELEILVGIANQSVPIYLFPIRVQKRTAGKSKTGLKFVVPTIRTIIELRRLRQADIAANLRPAE